MPWKQGSIIHLSDLQALDQALPDNCMGGLVITHDCDLANTIETEPQVEYLPFTMPDTTDGNLTNAKNPRTLQLELLQDGNKCCIQLSALQKACLLKTELAKFEPASGLLSDKERQILQGWLAARYRRHAFPDELVERMRPLSAYLEKQLRARARSVLGIWIDYDPKSLLSDEEPYELWLYIVYSTDSADNHSQAEQVASSISDRFATLDPSLGFILTACEAIAETGFTLSDQRRTIEFKLEHLSHRIYPDGDVIQ